MKQSPQNSSIYLDHNATTPISDLVLNMLQDQELGLSQSWGNPSSIHAAGRRPKKILRETRQSIGQFLGCDPLEVVFTSGGSEGNNAIIRSVFDEVVFKKTTRCEFVTTQVEHPSVLKPMKWIESLGYKVHFVPVSKSGELDLNFYKKVLSEKTALVSVMTANNETGVIHPISEMTRLAHEQGALFHTDAVQALGKINLNLHDLGVDYATFSAHKFYSLKGTGFMYLKKGAPFQSLVLGGGQERHRRGGTENIVGIAALQSVLPLLLNLKSQIQDTRQLRDDMEAQILQKIPGVVITAETAVRVPNTSSLVIEGVEGETLLMSLDLKGFAVSTGAACSSGNPEPSATLLAMGLTRQEAQSSLRISLGWTTTPNEVQLFIQTLVEVVERLRGLEKPLQNEVGEELR